MQSAVAIAVCASMLALAVLAPTGAARADGRIPVPDNPTWKTECGACHLPYPPRLLPARSWRAIMGGLDRHFGADASVEPKTAAEVTAFLERNSGRDRGDATVRITETSWFLRKHREVAAAAWRGPAVKSAGNCAACHRGAERGDYDEHSVRVPR
jgi:cytochrome c553